MTQGSRRPGGPREPAAEPGETDWVALLNDQIPLGSAMT